VIHSLSLINSLILSHPMHVPLRFAYSGRKEQGQTDGCYSSWSDSRLDNLQRCNSDSRAENPVVGSSPDRYRETRRGAGDPVKAQTGIP
jgi:hypothetical protein